MKPVLAKQLTADPATCASYHRLRFSLDDGVARYALVYQQLTATP